MFVIVVFVDDDAVNGPLVVSNFHFDDIGVVSVDWHVDVTTFDGAVIIVTVISVTVVVGNITGRHSQAVDSNFAAFVTKVFVAATVFVIYEVAGGSFSCLFVGICWPVVI